MSAENKALARRFIETFNTDDLTAVDEFIGTSFTNHDPGTPPLPTGPEGYRQLVRTYRTALPDLRLTVEDSIGEGDKVAVHWMARGTNTGELMGMPPTGKPATVTGISIFTIGSGKVTEQQVNWDTLGLLQQLGVVPTPGA
jgi:steroid delta-isomerase-like uncharacterized protein